LAHRRHAVLAAVSRGYPPPSDKSLRDTHPSATDQARKPNPCDLHVLSMPPAFALSQDQTLRFVTAQAQAKCAPPHRRTATSPNPSHQNKRPRSPTKPNHRPSKQNQYVKRHTYQKDKPIKRHTSQRPNNLWHQPSQIKQNLNPAKPNTQPKPQAAITAHHTPTHNVNTQQTAGRRQHIPSITDEDVNEPGQSQTWPHTPPNRTTRPITQGAHTIQPILIAATQPNAKPNQVGQRT